MIAYSTCSQLGYMFFAAGVSAYAAAIFHLFTHAFFKALLFLCAGSVIHAMCGEQDMRRMGGLWRKIPITYVMMWIGSLSLAGIPFVRRLFLEGHDPRRGLGVGDARSAAIRFCLGTLRRVPDRVLFAGGCVHDLPRQAARR